MINFQGNKKLSRHEPVSIKRGDDDDDDDVDDDRLLLHLYLVREARVCQDHFSSIFSLYKERIAKQELFAASWELFVSDSSESS